jgi:hypothetical protein
MLPFVVEEPKREKPFTPNMEKASLLCLAEAKRRKKPGMFGAQPESLIFLSKLHYPFWIVPWENESLIIDGLGATSFTIQFKKIPDAEYFIEQVKRSSSSHELYLSALKIHGETFKDFIATLEIPVEGVLSDKKLLSSIDEYLTASETRKKVVFHPESLISPKLSDTALLENVKKIIASYQQIQLETKTLEGAVALISEESKRHEEELQREIEQIQSFYADEISRIKPEIDKKLESLTMEMNEKLRSIEEAFGRERESQLKEREKLERELEKAEQSKSNLKSRLKSDSEHFVSKIKEYENNVTELKEKIRASSKFIEKLGEENANLTKEVKALYETEMEHEKKKIFDLEKLRDFKIEKKQMQINELHSMSMVLVNDIEALIRQKEAHALALKEIVVPLKLEQTNLVYVPFYIAEFKAETKIRYQVFPPLIASSHKGMLKKIQKLFRRSMESRIHMLLRSRSKALEKMLSKTFVKKIKADTTLQRILREKGLANNILSLSNFKEAIKDGIKELESEGWIKPEERETMLKTYVTS